MKRQISTLLLIFWISNTYSQNFINDSLMTNLVEKGFANENFIPEGKSKKGVRIGKWIDYTFEFIYTYQQNDDDVIDAIEEYLLIQSTGKFSNGQKNGLWKFNAVEAGTFKKYHIASVTFKNGKREGPITLFYSSGEIAAKSNYENKLRQGALTVYFKTGEIARKSQFIKDKLQGKMTFLYKTGEKKYTINHVDGIKHGVNLGYYKNGTIKSETKYMNGTLTGTSIIYYPNGKVQQEITYKEDEFSYLKYYYQSGQLWVHKEYKNGNYFNVIELYDSQGNSLDSGTLKDGMGTVKYYTEDAKIYAIWTFKDGKVIDEEEF